MSWWDRILGRTVPHTLNTPRVTYLGGSPLEMSSALDPSAWTASYMWRHQPHLRTVVSFRARNVAQLGLHIFRRVSDTDRERDHDSPLARALRRPDQMATYYDLMFALVGDLDLYDRAYWLVTADKNTGDPILRRLPPAWVDPQWKNPWEVSHYTVSLGDRVVDMPPEQVIAFGGYAPDAVRGCSSAVDALKGTLQEQIEAAGYRLQVWKRGGRASAVIQRPKDAPAWTTEQSQRFKDDWYANFTGDGPKAGGTPVLEDGMDIKQIDMNAREQQFVEAQRLHMQTVAAAYHVNPTMVGDNSGANYSNVREFRKMLYGDSLGPTLAQIENVVNAFLIPALGMDSDTLYAEFNLSEKLQGNFEEQAAHLQTSTGAPWMTRNEARARQNLPALDGGDEMVTPLNVLIGGQSSPSDGETAGGGGSAEQVDTGQPAEVEATVSGFTPDEIVQLINAATALIRSGFDPEGSLIAVGLDPVDHLGLLPVTVQRPQQSDNPDREIEDALKSSARVRRAAAARKAGGARVKSADPDEHSDRLKDLFARTFARQRSAVKTRLGLKDDEWWDAERWDRELADDLLEASLDVTRQAAEKVLSEIGEDPTAYNVERTRAYLEARSEGSAHDINEATREAIAGLLDDGGSTDEIDHYFDVAEGTRAETSAMGAAAALTGFASVEAARQARPGTTMKRWQTNSGNPRPSHAAMNGETVGLDEPFSNGQMTPGGFGAGVDESAGCQCSIQIVDV